MECGFVWAVQECLNLINKTSLFRFKVKISFSSKSEKGNVFRLETRFSVKQMLSVVMINFVLNNAFLFHVLTARALHKSDRRMWTSTRSILSCLCGFCGGFYFIPSAQTHALFFTANVKQCELRRRDFAWCKVWRACQAFTCLCCLHRTLYTNTSLQCNESDPTKRNAEAVLSNWI